MSGNPGYADQVRRKASAPARDGESFARVEIVGGGRLFEVLAFAIRQRTTFKLRFHPLEGEKFLAHHFVLIEQNINKWLSVALLTIGGLSASKIPRFRLDMESLKYRDEEGHWVDVAINFRSILPAQETPPCCSPPHASAERRRCIGGAPDVGRPR